MKNNWKRRIFTGIIIIVAILIISQVNSILIPSAKPQLTPALIQDRTHIFGNIRVYTDPINKFELEFPDTWSVTPPSPDLSGEGTYVLLFTKRDSPSEKYLFLSVKENWSVELEMNTVLGASSTAKIKNVESVKIGGNPATQFTYSTDEGIGMQKIVIMHKGTAFIFGFPVLGSSSEDDTKNVRNIMSSLSFIRLE